MNGFDYPGHQRIDRDPDPRVRYRSRCRRSHFLSKVEIRFP
jgi:hypothetical protein